MWKNHSRQTESPPPSLPPSLSLNFLSHKLSPGVRQNSTFQEGASTQLRTSALCQPTVSVNLKTVRRKHTNLTPSDAGKWIKHTRWRHINVRDLVNTRHLWGLLNNFRFGREQYFTKPIISFEWRVFKSASTRTGVKHDSLSGHSERTYQIVVTSNYTSNVYLVNCTTPSDCWQQLIVNVKVIHARLTLYVIKNHLHIYIYFFSNWQKGFLIQKL